VSSSRGRSFTSLLAAVADAVAEAAVAEDVVESADADAEAADAEAAGSADAAVAAVAAAVERGVCLGVGADPGAKRKQRSLKTLSLGPGRK